MVFFLILIPLCINSCTFIFPGNVGKEVVAVLKQAPDSIIFNEKDYFLIADSYRSSSVFSYSDTRISFFLSTKPHYLYQGEKLKAKCKNLWLVFGNQMVRIFISSDLKDSWDFTTFKEVAKSLFFLLAEFELESGEMIEIKSDLTGTMTLY